ncbi:MAG: class I SAM-dependent methyltransferase [Candidatus Bipolaricaulota bacterium]|nr:MAG: class I SAM-dependent methyltransferase [Candidatus Bipolaricaulota bacterium]
MDSLARYYDKIYGFKDYAAEAEKLVDVIATHLRSSGNCLLDVACGTGRHLSLLRDRFDVEGLDLSAEMLAVARESCPDIPFHQGDMRTFALDKRFDIVTCLFSSIGYVLTSDGLRSAMERMAAHLVPGGVLIVEPWLTPDSWIPGTVHGLFVDEPDLKIARVNTSLTVNGRSSFDLHHLIGTPEGTEHIVEHHELGLFTSDEMITAATEAGLVPAFDEEGLTGRGLLIGRRP